MARDNLVSPAPNFFSTSLNGAISASDLTITLNSVSGLPTKGYLIIDRKDTNGDPQPTKREIIYYTSIAGNAVVCPSVEDGRGVTPTTAQSHSDAAIVEGVNVSQYLAGLVTNIDAEHNDDGTHGAVTATSVSTDTVDEKTPNNGVTIDGLNIKDGKLNTNNSVIASNITDAIITNAKLSTATGELGGSWQSWTPTLTNLSGGTITYAKYIRIGKTVFFRFRYTLGGAGVSGNIHITPPITPHSDYTASADQLFDSVAAGIDVGNQIYMLSAFFQTDGKIHLRGLNASGTILTGATTLSATVPFTWGSGDIVTLVGTYEAA